MAILLLPKKHVTETRNVGHAGSQQVTLRRTPEPALETRRLRSMMQLAQRYYIRPGARQPASEGP